MRELHEKEAQIPEVPTQLVGSTLQGWAKVLQEAVYGVSQCPIQGAGSPTAGSHGSRKQGVDTGVMPLTITPSDSLTNVLLPVSVILDPATLEVSVPKGRMLSLGDTAMVPLNWK